MLQAAYDARCGCQIFSIEPVDNPVADEHIPRPASIFQRCLTASSTNRRLMFVDAETPEDDFSSRHNDFDGFFHILLDVMAVCRVPQYFCTGCCCQPQHFRLLFR